MPTKVTDAASHRQEKIANAARVVGRSAIRQKVFEAICWGKKHVKTLQDIRQRTDLNYMQIRQAAVVFLHEELVRREKVDGKLAYRRDQFYSKNRGEILRLAGRPKRLAGFPTSYTPKISGAGATRVIVKDRKAQAHRITIDDIDSFDRVRRIRQAGNPTPISENAFKIGLTRVLAEPGTFTDWGGETDDLYTTRFWLKGRRRAAAFGLKGKATKGSLTPKKMGKNGDQIQRLFRAAADAFLVQYWRDVDSSIHELMHKLAREKSVSESRPIFYGVLDGWETLRLIRAYKRDFRETGS